MNKHSQEEENPRLCQRVTQATYNKLLRNELEEDETPPTKGELRKVLARAPKARGVSKDAAYVELAAYFGINLRRMK